MHMEETIMAESMKDFEKELEESYTVMGDGEKDEIKGKAIFKYYSKFAILTNK